MQTRRLGSSDMDITAVGFGMGAIAWLDDSSWIRARGDAQGALRRALELGVNWIDAALWGHSIEHSAARVIEGWPGEKPYVFTRCVRYRSTREGLEVSVPFDAVGIRRACEDSLRDLQPHAIDLYVADLPPGLDPDWSSNAWWTMAQLQREGKVRWIGLGDCDVQQLRMAQEVAPVTAVASPWLPMDAEVGREILPHCAAAGIGVIGHLPRFGELPPRGSRFEAGTRLAIAKRLGIRAAHLRLEGLHQLEPGTTRALAAASELERIAGEHGRSVDEVAVAWGTQLSAITGVAISALTAAQVEDSLGDGAFRLADEDIARIDAAWR